MSTKNSNCHWQLLLLWAYLTKELSISDYFITSSRYFSWRQDALMFSYCVTNYHKLRAFLNQVSYPTVSKGPMFMYDLAESSALSLPRLQSLTWAGAFLSTPLSYFAHMAVGRVHNPEAKELMIDVFLSHYENLFLPISNPRDSLLNII